MKLNIVPARTGLAWFRAGLRTFWQQPLALAGLFFMFISIMSVASLLPYVGSVLALALLPAATLGLMAATHEAAQGKFPMPSILISAFRAGRQEARSIAILGALHAVGISLLLLLVSALIDGGQLAGILLLGQTITTEAMSPRLPHAVQTVAVLTLPLTLIFSLAPALVHWHGITPVKSLFFSVVGLVRNAGALFVLLLCLLVATLAAVIAITLISALFMSQANPATLLSIFQPVAMLLSAMFTCTLYFVFRDSFVADDEPPAADTTAAV